jgi:hypothetical protein
MGLFQDVLGGLAAANGGKMIAGTAGAAANGVLASTANAQNGINTALNNANTNVNQATGAAISGVNSATGAANTTLNQSLQSSGIPGYVQSGEQGQTALQNYAGQNGGLGPQFTQADVNNQLDMPALQFQMQQGQNAIQNTAASQGLANSGAAAKELTQYGQGLASTYYNQAFNQAQSQFQTNQNATMQNLGALTQAGEYGSSQNLGVAGQQASNTLNSGYYAGNTGVQGQEYLGGLNLQGQTTAGQEGMQGSTLAGNFDLEGQEAAVGGNLGETQAFGQGLSSLASLAMMA